jgi:hypothetical protein
MPLYFLSFFICIGVDIRVHVTYSKFAWGLSAVLRIRVPVPFYPWIRDPGWVKNQNPDPV